MKKTLFLSLFAVFILISSSALAAVQEYRTRIGTFSIDVPDGWKGTAVQEGCRIDSVDGKNTVTVQFIPPKPIDSLDLAKAVAKAMEMKITKESNENNCSLLEGTLADVPTLVLVVKDEHMILTSIISGPDRQAMISIYKSVQGK